MIAGLAAERVVRRRFASWGYAEREDDLLVRRGVLFSRLSVVPYGRMQFVDVTAGPLERSFRLATVKMHTAAADDRRCLSARSKWDRWGGRRESLRWLVRHDRSTRSGG